MFFNKLWDKLGNITSLSQYQGVLKRQNVSKNMKNFYVCKSFFKYLFNIHIIILPMKINSHKSIDEFKA